MAQLVNLPLARLTRATLALPRMVAPPSRRCEQSKSQSGQNGRAIGREGSPRPRPRSTRRTRRGRRLSPSSTIPMPPGVSGSAPRMRTSDQAANASIHETSAPDTPTARRQATGAAEHGQVPDERRRVSTCHRRRRNPSARTRKAARFSPPHVTGSSAYPPEATGREPRGEIADLPRPPRARERERERSNGDDEDAEADEGCRSERGMVLVFAGQEREPDDREREIRELVPDAGDGDRERDRAGAEAPRAEHRVGARHPDGGARRRDQREGGRGLRHHERLPVAETRQRRHPGRGEGREIEHGHAGEDQAVLPAEGFDDSMTSR